MWNDLPLNRVVKDDLSKQQLRVRVVDPNDKAKVEFHSAPSPTNKTRLCRIFLIIPVSRTFLYLGVASQGM